ncbi:tetratricopeptide repeat protein [candidate division WOR-3 bacterium]|nr:tetratricopeptide repeat protein [candidate division WOR-3 bacterium]
MGRIGKEYIDDLTGLYNRRYLYIEAPRKIEETQEMDIPLSIVSIDLDHFKNVNDTYGHARGDIVLNEFGEFLKTVLRHNDTVYRYGGDEFICILPNANYTQAKMVSRRFVERCRIKEFAQIRLTLSIGIASCPENAKDWHTLFNIADRNLYSAKRRGRDRIGIFEKEKKGLKIPVKEIIGRDEEITRIKEAINSIFNGSGGAVCISGEVGVGKTRLVQEIIKDSDFQDIQFLSSNLSATTKSIPYYSFREIIRTVMKEEGEKSIHEIPKAYQIELVKIVPELSDSFSAADKNIFMVDKFRLFEGVRQFLARRASKESLFICLDNIHWANDSSLELLHYLVRALRKSPIFFFLIYRVEEVKHISFQNMLHLMSREGLYKRIDLEPLETADVARMLSLIIDGNPPFELTDYILKETGGNPFFIEELMKSLDANGAFIWDKDKWVFDKGKKVVIPYSVEGVVDRKLGMMDNEACDLLQYAAVVGREFDFTFLRDITKMNEGHLFDLMDEILGMKLLKETGGEQYRFSEDIIREIIYGQINKVKLRRYHKAVGERLLSLHKDRIKEVVEELSHHFYLSGDKEKAIEYSMIAADRAKNVYANQDAIRFYTWAIESTKGSTGNKEIKKIECLKKRAGVFNLIGKNEKAAMDLEEAIKKAKVVGDRKWEADCLIEFCKVFNVTAQYHKSAKEAEKALKLYQELNDRKGEAKCLINIGVVHFYLGEYSKALKFCQDSLKIAKKIGTRKIEATGFTDIGLIYSNLGEYSKALEFYKRSLKIDREIGASQGEATSLIDIGAAYLDIGEYSKALESYQHSLKIVKKIGNRRVEAGNLTNIGIIHSRFGEYSKAIEFYRQSLKIVKEIGARRGEAISLNNIGSIHMNLGEHSKALEFYQCSLKITEEMGSRKAEAVNLNNIGEVYYNFGEYSRALEFFKRSLKIKKKISDYHGEAESLLGIGETFLEMNDFSTAGKNYNKAYSIAQKINSKPLLASVLLDLASLDLEKNNLVELRKVLKGILSLADELGSKTIKAKALCLSGRLYTKEKKWDKTKSSFKKSISIFKQLKRKFDLARVYYYQGLMFRESGDKTNAKKSFARAKEIFKKLSAKTWIEKVTRRGSGNQDIRESEDQEELEKGTGTR